MWFHGYPYCLTVSLSFQFFLVSVSLFFSFLYQAYCPFYNSLLLNFLFYFSSFIYFLLTARLNLHFVCQYSKANHLLRRIVGWVEFWCKAPLSLCVVFYRPSVILSAAPCSESGEVDSQRCPGDTVCQLCSLWSISDRSGEFRFVEAPWLDGGWRMTSKRRLPSLRCSF